MRLHNNGMIHGNTSGAARFSHSPGLTQLTTAGLPKQQSFDRHAFGIKDRDKW